MGITNPKLKDRIWWSLTLILLAIIVGGHYYLANYSLLLRIVGLLIVGSMAIALAAKTAFGQKVWSLWLEAVQEVRKMYWPTRQETMQTVFAVFAMVVVMGILLWTADFMLLKAVKWLTGNWGA